MGQSSKLLNIKTSHLTILATLFIAIFFLRLKILGFDYTEDSPCWEQTITFFSDFQTQKIGTHCLFNPGFPAFTFLIDKVISIGTFNSAILLNLLSFAASTLLVYKLTKHFFTAFIGLVTSLLFITNYYTLYYVFTFQPDVLSWLMSLLIMYQSYKLLSEPRSAKNIISTSTSLAIAILVKANLGFFALFVALILLYKRQYKSVILLTIFTSVPVLVFYSWASHLVNAFPWSSFENGIQTESASLTDHLISFISANLYIFPLFILALKLPKKITSQKLTFAAFLMSLILPIVAWPYVSPRFYYTLFPFLLPLAAFGIYRISKKLFATPTASKLATMIAIGIISLMNFLRFYISQNNLSHIQFVQSLVLKII